MSKTSSINCWISSTHPLPQRLHYQSMRLVLNLQRFCGRPWLPSFQPVNTPTENMFQQRILNFYFRTPPQIFHWSMRCRREAVSTNLALVIQTEIGNAWTYLDARHTGTLQPHSSFRISNYEALMAMYNYLNYSKWEELCYDLPETKKEQFQSLILEGHLLACRALQASLDSADTAARSIALLCS
ncbi:hypothetical protein KIL84_019533 [Mauremys mutica]|uniref:Uncharacterized protein n=1 Tax=Mauremys mutica TaxID=74926 RepID=A0A9D3XU02_9SAUR|nr:hypothetical protein KIL84_019533 [Mauremys mutica]